MASILRQIVAGPRLQHPEAGIDLCYVTDHIIATSGPSSYYPQRAYRTPLKDLVNFLDAKHDTNWCIWEFRAEGTGYPDSEVYGRIHHYPFPDHHPPPFALIPALMASMRDWIHRLDEPRATRNFDSDIDRFSLQQEEHKQEEQDKTQEGVGEGEDELKQKEKEEEERGKLPSRVAVVHCKAGKGRSGTVACSYLISQEGWKMEDALHRFTERRMRVGFGSGVSIPSQLRWVRYVDQWTNQLGKKYVERPVEILELHVWGLRDGVKVAVEGFVEQGRKIKCFHLFHRDERIVMDADGDRAATNASLDQQPLSAQSENSTWTNISSPSSTTEGLAEFPTKLTSAVLLRPRVPLILPTPDVNIDFERKSKAAYTGLAMVTSIAHVWFNPYFEGGDKCDSGVFEVDWEALDGIKGTTKKGIKALDKLKVVWRYPPPSQQEEAGLGSTPGEIITEPNPGEPVHESCPADWRLQAQDPDKDEDEHGSDDSNEGRPGRDQENVPLRHTETIPIQTKKTENSDSLDPTLAATAGQNIPQQQPGFQNPLNENEDARFSRSIDDPHTSNSNNRATERLPLN